MKRLTIATVVFFSLVFYVVAFAQSTTGTVNRGANLRSGPGTTYAIVGKAAKGQAVMIIDKNKAGDWYQLEGGQWIAAFLVTVDTAPSLASDDVTPLPTNQPGDSSTPAATVAPTLEPTPTPVVDTGQSIVNINEELQGKGWRFKVSEIHKRKAVYWGRESYVAMGHFLVVIVDAVNEQSGTDYFSNNLGPYLTDDPGNAYTESWKGTIYATWQYGGLDTSYTDVNPGKSLRFAMAFDIPDNSGHVMLSTDLPGWVDLGDFSAMKSEDK